MVSPNSVDTRTNFDLAPPWFKWALHEIGVKENPLPHSSNDRITAYRKIGKTSIGGDDGAVPWCAIFVNAALEANGVAGTKSALAQSFARSKVFIKLETPLLGCIVVFWRGTRNSGLGHVGFCRAVRNNVISVLGGNQGDATSVKDFAATGRAFGLLGYYWPKDYPVDGVPRAPTAFSSAKPVASIKVT